MLKNANKTVAVTMLGVLSVSSLGLLSTPAEASTKGRRNTTIALGAVTAYGLLKGNKTVAIAGGVGTALAYGRYDKSKRAQKRRRQSWYRQRYGSRSWRNHYPS